MHALVTGGAGFLGSHLVGALLRRGWSVTVVDDLSTGRRQNLRGLSCRLREARVGALRPPDLRDATHVFHLAARVSVPRSFEDPEADLRTNSGETLHLVELCRRVEVERLVFASSAAVYGRPRSIPIREDHPREPLSPYGVSKLAGETYCRLYHRIYGLPAVALRVFNAYGPRQTAEGEAGVVARFARAVREGNPLEVHGTGRQTRDFIYAGDVAEAFVRAAEARGAAGECVNVGTGTGSSILALVRAFRRVHPEARVARRPARAGEVGRSVASTAKARRLLRFRARTPLGEGIARTLESA